VSECGLATLSAEKLVTIAAGWAKKEARSSVWERALR
jgi:hypothetical protein